MVPLGWAELYTDMHHASDTLAVHGLGVCVFTYIVCIYIRVVRVGERIQDLHRMPQSTQETERQAALTLPEMFFNWEGGPACGSCSVARRAAPLSRLQHD